MARGKQFTKAELEVIRLGIKNKHTIVDIAKFLGRARQSVHIRINKMRENGELAQTEMDMGQCDDE